MVDRTETMVDVCADPSKTLAEWRDQIDELIEKYGPSAVLFTDGGYNNVELVLETKPEKR